MTAASTPTSVQQRLDPTVFSRNLAEGYGSGAWHGPDLASALSDVTDELAFRRVAPGRHNIAEVALHHAWAIRSVRAQITGEAPDAFPLDGEDRFELEARTAPTWDEVRAIVDRHQESLTQSVADIGAGRIASPLAASERFGLVLGITCHAVYHAGQVQLLKRLLG